MVWSIVCSVLLPHSVQRLVATSQKMVIPISVMLPSLNIVNYNDATLHYNLRSISN